MAALRVFARFGLPAFRRASLAVVPGENAFPILNEVQKRRSSYKSSSVYNETSAYTDFEISKDPKEWMYVERLFRVKVVPPPPTGVKEFPSGWKPQSENALQQPYYVGRSKNHMQPVYLKITGRGLRRVTILCKIEGDIWALEADLKKYLEEKTDKRLRSRIHEPAGQLKFRGDYVSRVKEWLDMKGF